ncbi:hypothetical protein ASE41_33805 [Streptomyces sp. Root264]|nr:hypothetical protein ASE41_33805 [Streptomyces sp. Root264]
MQRASLSGERHADASAVLRAQASFDETVLLQTGDEPRQRALAEMDAFGDLLDAEAARDVLRGRLGEDVEHLEVAGAQAVPVQCPVEFALGACVQGQHVAPLLHERLLGLGPALLHRHGAHRSRALNLLHLN